MSKYKDIKEQAYLANMELPKQKVVIYTFGNVSALDRDKGVYAIKPSGVPYSHLKPDDMVIVDLENNIVEGKLRPSSDTKTHTVLYNAFDEVNGIVHTHSKYAVAWAQARRPIPCYGTTHADHLAFPVPCTKVISDDAIKGNYEHETGLQILDTLKDLNYKEIEMVLVACHGPFTWGKTAAKAVYNSVVLEELAQMALFTEQISPDAEPIKKTMIEKHYNRKHGKDAYYGQ